VSLRTRYKTDGSLERYAQGDENEEILQGLLDDARGIARYGAGGV